MSGPLGARAKYGSRLARLAAAVARARISRTAGIGQQRADSWNTMFRRSQVESLLAPAQVIGRFNASLHATLFDSRVEGQLVFEYGTLVDWVSSWQGARVLDVGTGRSTLPRWMRAAGANVVTLDHSAPVESPPGGWLDRLDGWFEPTDATPPFVAADMSELPFRDSAFDLLTCLSVLEHLDTELPTRRYVAPVRQRQRLQRTLEEFVRVLRPGGHLYLTTECCDYSHATVDAWRPAYYFTGDGPRFSGAWPVQDIRELFVEELSRHGCVLVGRDRLDPAAIADPDTWTWRGPYFSAIAVLARKGAA